MNDFTNISYLQSGSPVQQHAYKVLSDYKILEQLITYTPILCGTIPIDIAITGSDLDIICKWETEETFTSDLHRLFGNYPNFQLWKNSLINAVIASFKCGGFTIEVFGQSTPTVLQNAYRHMVIEHNILNHYGGTFKSKIIALKEQGYKTEPAFAKLLQLQGDPYSAILNYTIH